MIYKLKIYDNFHYQDESEAWVRQVDYETYEEALNAAQTMVEEDIEHYYKEGMSANELIGAYCSFGDDPDIYSEPPGGGGGFSAWSYAQEYAPRFLKYIENEKEREKLKHEKKIETELKNKTQPTKESCKSCNTVYKLEVSSSCWWKYEDDEDQIHFVGNYATYEMALNAAKERMERDIRAFYKPGMTAKELIHIMVYDHPEITSIPESTMEDFSTDKYAQDYVVKYLKLKKKKKS